ncbi:Cell death specification protein 2 [Frankliniella fusca]|uniref:Cell death specification protein 2 n=1 Tax=Frankliniella fusca TaxID=407009 RepID=A0AAE1H3W5_9NEOP|nr:Cell death specification protein 2 [Frankliniella fusca]
MPTACSLSASTTLSLLHSCAMGPAAAAALGESERDERSRSRLLYTPQIRKNQENSKQSRKIHKSESCFALGVPAVQLALPLALPGAARRPRSEKKPTPEEQKDQRYLERRRRNNRAAKKSRDARRAREDQVALRAALLEHENAVLRAQVLTLREETHQLRQLLISKPLQLQPLQHLQVAAGGARRDEAPALPPSAGELLLRRMLPA